MNKPSFISPSALDLWLKNREEYYLKYLSTDKPPRLLQNNAMSVGSAFDAYAKSFIHQNLFGKNHKDSGQFDFQTIFESQVEPQNRDWALKAGAVCFDQYRTSGALEKLIVLLQRSDIEIRMEFSACGAIQEHGVAAPVEGVIILGKPDIFFRLKGVNIIFDWKVNGFVSANGHTPVQGYIKYLEPKSTKHGKMHKDASPHYENGLEYSLTPSIEEAKPEWARQLCAYSWLCGAEVGSEIIIAVDQLVCRPSMPDPIVGVAQHRCIVTAAFQRKTLKAFQDCWNAIQTGHIFDDMTPEENERHCQLLAQRSAAFSGESANDAWLRGLRQNRNL